MLRTTYSISLSTATIRVRNVSALVKMLRIGPFCTLSRAHSEDLKQPGFKRAGLQAGKALTHTHAQKQDALAVLPATLREVEE